MKGGEGMEENKKEAIPKGIAIQQKIEELLIENNLSYRNAIAVLGSLLDDYRHKGSNLLDAENIKKVAETPRFVK